ncbi:hypothetical protein [Flexistipes sinusarabici]|uniref:hypothetical protein n=1 Tax=Flexistipes sinusarabici TaxID=2352 RepID=UPI00145ECB02|nr:hypothetical protein [Flexistipes sinusarabici]
MKKVVQKNKLEKFDQIKKDLEYWLSLPVSERLSAVEKLRKQQYGSTERLQRVLRVFKQKQC